MLDFRGASCTFGQWMWFVLIQWCDIW